MNFQTLINALKDSAASIVTAGGPGAAEELQKSIDQFAARAGQMVSVAPEQTDHVGTLGRTFDEMVKAVGLVEAGDFLLLKGGAKPEDGKMELLKCGLNIAGVALNLMAAEQATPADNEDEARAEGMGLFKVAFDGGEQLLKHSLAEEGMRWLRDPIEATQEGQDEALAALALLGVDTDRLLKAFEEAEGAEDEPPAAGGADNGGEGAGGEGDAGDDDPIMNMARMGVATMTTAGAVLDAGGAELPEEIQQILAQIAEAGAVITTHADHLAQLHAAEEGEEEEPSDGQGAGEGEVGAKEPPQGEKPAAAKGEGEGEDGKPKGDAPSADAKPGSEPPKGEGEDEGKKKPKAREPEMALAARTGELAKSAAAFLAKARMPVSSAPAATPAPAPAAPEPAAPALPANAPAARVVPVSKALDGGGEPLSKQEADATLEQLAKMAPADRERAAVYLALRAPPIPLPPTN